MSVRCIIRLESFDSSSNAGAILFGPDARIHDIRIANRLDNLDLILRQYRLVEHALDFLPGIGLIFLHAKLEQVDRIDLDGLSELADLFEGQLGLALLDHRDDVWFGEPDRIGNFVLLLAAQVNLPSDVLSDSLGFGVRLASIGRFGHWFLLQ